MEVILLKKDGEVMVAFNGDLIDLDEIPNVEEYEVDYLGVCSELEDVLDALDLPGGNLDPTTKGGQR